jgi:perosamine synthetase
MKKMIPVSEPLFSGNEVKYVTDSVKSTWVRTGKYLDDFEAKFAKFCESKYSLATSSGTTALDLIFLALNLKKGDEVLVPDMTYVASANTVVHAGGKPIFVDVDKDSWNISVDRIEKKITNKTKAIEVVHLLGSPAEMDEINAIAKKHGLVVIEDACQAHGAIYKGKKVGSLAEAACFSFSGAKIITTGEGGMITTNNKQMFNRANDINNDFMSKSKKFYHTEIGYNFRLTNLQAALGLAQLEQIEKLIKAKINNAKIYTSYLKFFDTLQLPVEKPWSKNIYWLYAVVLKKTGLRDKMMRYLLDEGIETRPFFTPMHALPMYRQKGDYSVSEYLADNGVCLPSSTSLKISEIEYICEKIGKFLRTYA